jgi:hypothetical protein
MLNKSSYIAKISTLDTPYMLGIFLFFLCNFAALISAALAAAITLHTKDTPQ